MKAKDFYRILSRVPHMEWELQYTPKVFGVPSTTQFIRGRLGRVDLFHNPISAVASAVRRKFVDRSDKGIAQILHLNPRTYRRIVAASYQQPGYSPAVRRKLLKACGLL